MTYRTPIQGSLVALVTPMHDDGKIDYPALADLIEWHIEQGTDGIVSVGTTGESATLTVAEHLEVIEFTITTAAGRIPVLGGTGGNATAEAIELTSQALEMGAAACLLVTPYYNKPPQLGLLRHYEAIAKTCDGPLILYNVPGRTGCDLLPSTVGQLLEYDNIVGIKEACGSFDRIRELLDLDPGFAVYTGDDATARESMLMGCRGDISVTANVAPAAMHRMCAAAIAGDSAAAGAIDAKLAGLHYALFLDSNPIPAKWALHAMGKIGPGIRLPLVPMNSAHEPALREALNQAEIAL